MRDATARRRAVTLLELLVTIAATVVLTAILIVTIRGVRGQTLSAMNINNLRMSMQDLHAWSAENDSKMLNIESPQSYIYRTGFRDYPNPSDRFFRDVYWGQITSWSQYLFLATGQRHKHWTTAYPEPVANDPNIPPHAGRVVDPTFLYSPTMITSSSLWTVPPPSTSIEEASAYFRTVRVSDIAHPGRKGVLVHLHAAQEGAHHIAFADGHAAAHRDEDLTPPTTSPTSMVGAPGRPVLHTPAGHEGVDR